jgi:peptide/nickel transport system permease protein
LRCYCGFSRVVCVLLALCADWHAAVLLVAIAAPVVAPTSRKCDFRAMSKPPDAKHYFGTDQIGRDTLSRVIHGSRASLTVAFGAVLFGTTLGALWGLASGYFGGASISSASD